MFRLFHCILEFYLIFIKQNTINKEIFNAQISYQMLVDKFYKQLYKLIKIGIHFK